VKNINIGGMNLNIPEADKDITRLINALNDIHESGKLKSILVVYAEESAYGTSFAGNFMYYPSLAVLAAKMADRMMRDFTASLDEDGEEDGEEDDV
jgi:hypothetical protein